MDVLNKVDAGVDLSHEEMREVVAAIMEGAMCEDDIVRFLEAINAKEPSITELIAAAEIMREKSVRLDIADLRVLDTCGTGGDLSHTFNISTAAAFVSAACGVPVAKHGNRSVTSKSGSADVLEALGVSIELSADQTQTCLETQGIAFLFAPLYHPAMKHAAAARKRIKEKTIFNVLGPLSNPAGAKHQLIGVYSPDIAPKMLAVLEHFGSTHVIIVHGNDGLDEVTVCHDTHIWEFKDGEQDSYTFSPEEYGINIANIEDLRGGSAEDNAVIILDILRGEKGPKHDIVVLNSAFALLAADLVDNITMGIELASNAIDTRSAYSKLQDLVAFTRAVDS